MRLWDPASDCERKVAEGDLFLCSSRCPGVPAAASGSAPTGKSGAGSLSLATLEAARRIVTETALRFGSGDLHATGGSAT